MDQSHFLNKCFLSSLLQSLYDLHQVNIIVISHDVKFFDEKFEEMKKLCNKMNEENNYDHNDSHNNCDWPMKNADFSSAKQTISSANFEDSKLSTAKGIIASNCLNTDQVVEICRLFDFEQTKLTFAKLAYKKTTDQKNYFKVNNVFDFDNSKQELSSFTGGN